MEFHAHREMNSQRIGTMGRLWRQLRKLIVFQIKLYVDAFRDLLLSALALGAFIVDLVLHNDGPDSYFEKVLQFGRSTERSINLFNQFSAQERGPRSVDGVIEKVEERFKR